jgi:hypothetical protein
VGPIAVRAHGQNPLDHAGKHGPLLLGLAGDGQEAIRHLRRHLVQRPCQRAHFRTVRNGGPSLEIAVGQPFGGSPHLLQRSADPPGQIVRHPALQGGSQ